MTIGFYIIVQVRKFFANIVSAVFFNKELRHRVRYRLDPLNPERCVSYLEKHYTQVEPIAKEVVATGAFPVWVCWLQGLEEAPMLVRNCIRSIERHMSSSQRLIVLNTQNYADYIDLPEVIITKWKKGQITNTHFSDILRIHALARYGGCWIDATCYMTSPVPVEILQAPLFLFRTHGEFSYTYIQSCFMVSKPNSYVMRKWCAAICAYWEQENALINYFTLHLMFIALLHRDTLFKTEFEHVKVMSDEPMHMLLYEMKKGGDYSDALMEAVRAQSFMQKLTYKFPSSLLENKNSIASRFSQSDVCL